jgi:protein transport protein SEC24
VDIFLISSAYQDVASLGGSLFSGMRYQINMHCSKPSALSTGQTYYYRAFSVSRSEDAVKFAHEFWEVLAMSIIGERCAGPLLRTFAPLTLFAGLRMASSHGNFFVRLTDLLAIPTIPQNQSYVIQNEIEDRLTAPFIFLQEGMLHTT